MARTPTAPAALAAALLAPPLVAQGWLDTARHFVQPDPGEFHAIADFDGNGADDLVWFRGTPGTPTHYEGFRVVFNDGTGDLPGAGPFVSFTLINNRFRPISEDGVHRAEDATGDGRPDVFVVEELDYQTDVLLHLHPSAGTGTFGPPVSAPLTGAVRGAAFGQADGDAPMELAVLEVSGFSWIVTWFDFTGGALVPSASVTVPFPSPFGFKHPARLVAVDVDHDGDDDVVVGESSGRSLRVFPTVAGAPTTATVLAVPGTTYHRIDPYVVDLAGGGAEDLMLIVMENSSDSLDLQPALLGPGGLAFGAAHTITPSFGATFGGRFAFDDWDGDGDPDLLNYAWQEPGGSTEAIVAFFENDGADHFSGPVAKAETVHVGTAPFGTSDLDLDGHLDVALPQGALFGRGRFESSLEAATSFFFGPSPVDPLDHDGDGDVDLFLDDGSVRLNDGTGRFPEVVFPPPLPAGVVERSITSIGDFTGDGRTDVLAAHYVPGQPLPIPVFQEMRLYADDGLGGFADAGPAATSSMTPYSRRTNVAFDLDADGDLDVLDATPGGYFPNAGSGTFLPFVPLLGSGHEPCAVADVDQDGDADVAAVDNWTSLTVWTNQGGLSFTGTLVHTGGPSLEPDSVSLADHDGDGDLDLAFSQSWGETTFLYVNGGSGTFTPGAVLDTGTTSKNDPPMTALSFDDVDGDGTIDLLAGAAGTFSDTPRDVLLYRGLGGGAFEAARPYAGGAMGPPADLDGDGDRELSGRVVVRSRRFDGPGDGTIRQYGQGLAGSGGAVPVLGARGPVRLGSTTAELRLRRGVGGAPVVLLFGPNEGALPNLPVFGATLYVDFPLSTLTLPSGGAAGVPGAGTLDLGLVPVLPVVAGFTIHVQAAVLDGGAADGIATSNGLELTFGT